MLLDNSVSFTFYFSSSHSAYVHFLRQRIPTSNVTRPVWQFWLIEWDSNSIYKLNAMQSTQFSLPFVCYVLILFPCSSFFLKKSIVENRNVDIVQRKNWTCNENGMWFPIPKCMIRTVNSLNLSLFSYACLPLYFFLIATHTHPLSIHTHCINLNFILLSVVVKTTPECY